MLIKKEPNLPELEDFSATNGWCEKWNISYGIREKKVVGEAGDVPTETIDAWIERIRELRLCCL